MPVIKKSPEEIKSAGWGTYDAVKSYGWTQIDTLRSFVSNQAEKASSSSYGQVVIRSVDTALELTDSVLDNYLPPAEGEEETVPERGIQRRCQSWRSFFSLSLETGSQGIPSLGQNETETDSNRPAVDEEGSWSP